MPSAKKCFKLLFLWKIFNFKVEKTVKLTELNQVQECKYLFFASKLSTSAVILLSILQCPISSCCLLKARRSTILLYLTFESFLVARTENKTETKVPLSYIFTVKEKPSVIGNKRTKIEQQNYHLMEKHEKKMKDARWTRISYSLICDNFRFLYLLTYSVLYICNMKISLEDLDLVSIDSSLSYRKLPDCHCFLFKCMIFWHTQRGCCVWLMNAVLMEQLRKSLSGGLKWLLK